MNPLPKTLEKKFALPFVIVTSLFALWGFANDITNPLVAAFKTLMEIPNSKAALVQFAFYGGYTCMALPAAMFIQKYSYKKGILLGLALYATGAFMFYPAARFEIFELFLLSLYVLTFGLAFLETTANPYILQMGDPRTATRRLNLAQAFNPVGSLLGMTVAAQIILKKLQSDARTADGELIYPTLGQVEKTVQKTADLILIRDPYLVLGFVVLVMFVIVLLTKMPEGRDTSLRSDLKKSLERLLGNRRYKAGVVTQAFYVGAQIMCWTFIIQYGEHLGMTKSEAQVYNIVAMSIFLASRFLTTWLMKFMDAKKLLMYFALGGVLTMTGTIFIEGHWGLYCLVATSAFMSLMFPTIYGIALEDLGNDSTYGSAGLVMAIVGGALMPPLQGAVIDLQSVGSMAAVRISFVIPLVSFIVIAGFGYLNVKGRLQT